MGNKYLFLSLLVLASFVISACQRNNVPYGGVDQYEGNPPYDTKFDVNKPVSSK
jgi:hypothetical protein